MMEMKCVVRSLLELPPEIKSRNADVAIAGSGYMPPSQINPLYQALGLYDMASPLAVNAFCDNLGATPHQRSVMLNYANAVNKLMAEIAAKIGQSLGLIDGLSIQDWACQFRINRYDFTPETVNSPGVQLHTDSSFLTVLQDDDVIGGLEVMKRCGEFVAVDPCPGTLLVNLGDIAAVWSNGRFLNVKHRVMCKEPGVRISVASFLLGPKEDSIEAPSEIIGSEHPRLFVPFTYKEYRQLRVSKRLQTGETLYCFRV
ncbi:2-oxoglutarate (2OG) and Fe(II)-dependent oxygenase superfamily protein [Striga hermonthica]|uniref:2-oxoglutarate (2OG) and Fe(II)-dependent oxygenase superfamily protein n=1 Tax=Striga hermonthica TaxID=68872 RepID=A0A9N7RIE8_STRHE|nr:2-oxoglutarate (2OG) and Fe(II)-dependent oxygenase superfamily protein [Striga hermonthica]